MLARGDALSSPTHEEGTLLKPVTNQPHSDRTIEYRAAKYGRNGSMSCVRPLLTVFS